jgi:hypothetical protein
MKAEHRNQYGKLMHAITAQTQAAMPSSSSPEKAAQVVPEAIMSERPKIRYTVGRDASAIVFLIRILSDRMLDRLLKYAVKGHFTNQVSR